MESYIERLMNYLNRQLLIEQLQKRGVPYFAREREGRYLYEYIFKNYVHEPVDYLEFGVASGNSMSLALSRLSAECNLYGFDSFEGLPENWYFKRPKGTFSTGGVIPDLNAPNLTFIKGWFEESLLPFLHQTVLKPRLVVHLDADLYSSTIYVLRTMKDFLCPGTILLFDEFWFLKDEFRAWQEFIRETGKRFEYLAISDARAAVRITIQ